MPVELPGKEICGAGLTVVAGTYVLLPNGGRVFRLRTASRLNPHTNVSPTLHHNGVNHLPGPSLSRQGCPRLTPLGPVASGLCGYRDQFIRIMNGPEMIHAVV